MFLSHDSRPCLNWCPVFWTLKPVGSRPRAPRPMPQQAHPGGQPSPSLSVCLSVCLSVLSVSLSVCLSVCLAGCCPALSVNCASSCRWVSHVAGFRRLRSSGPVIAQLCARRYDHQREGQACGHQRRKLFTNGTVQIHFQRSIFARNHSLTQRMRSDMILLIRGQVVMLLSCLTLPRLRCFMPLVLPAPIC